MLRHRFPLSPFSPVFAVHTNAFSKSFVFETRSQNAPFSESSIFQMSSFFIVLVWREGETHLNVCVSYENALGVRYLILLI